MKMNKKLIHEQFDVLMNNYALEWTRDSDYIMTLENEDIKIEMQMEKWEDGISLNLFNKQKSEFFDLEDLELSKGFNSFSSYLDDDEMERLNSLERGSDKLVYAFSILLKKYFEEPLKGNFQLLGKGKDVY